MASIHQRNETWWVKFRFGGKQIFRSLKTDNERNAERLKLQIERTLADIDHGRMVIPLEADLWQFILSDGKLAHKPSVPTAPATLTGLMDAYFAGQIGQKEANTLVTERYHRKHIERLIGGSKAIASFTTADVQAYIRARATEGVGRNTIKKEVATLRFLVYRAWQLVGAKPATDVREMFRALDFPRGKEQPPFQTWDEIEQQIARLKPDAKERKALWDCVFLDVAQVTEFLDWAEAKAARHPVPFFIPLLTAAAHTGARLSELVRSQAADWNLDKKEVVLREKKKSKTKDTTRRVSLSDRVVRVMRDWFENFHPGGRVAFCREPDVLLTGKNLRNVFDRFVGKHKWSVLKGYHVFRHSFASNLARTGTDQRVIDELMGHSTEDMRRRYRHLFPEQRRDAVQKLFG
jgi:integrase